MTKQHTPGPWAWQGDLYKELVSLSNPKIGPNGAAQYTVVIDDGSAAGEYSQMIDPEGPDARLIAASPDLLDALQSLVDMDVSYQRGQKVSDAVDKARAAIAKATGEHA